MHIPNTPKSTIGEMLRLDRGAVWEHAWRRFCEIYYAVIRCMVRNTFTRLGWPEPNLGDLEEVISAVMESVIRDFESKKYKPDGNRLRGYLKSVVNYRVMDFFRRHNKKSVIPAKMMDMACDMLALADETQHKPSALCDASEERLYKKRVLLDAWENVRTGLSPQTCIIFEMIKLEERDPKTVMRELDITRNTLDRAVFKAMQKLRERLAADDYRKELES